jgi:hypothetical protein
MGLPKSRLHDIYENEVKPALIKERGLENPMQVPRLKMVKVNIGVGEAKDNAKALEGTVKTLTVIAGQKPVVTRAKKSISNFKLREGQPVGVTVTHHAAARPGLPGRQRQGLRRARQLQPGAARPADFPRDHLRRSGSHQGNAGHHHHNRR